MKKNDGVSQEACNLRHEMLTKEITILHEYFKEIRTILYTVLSGVIVGLITQEWDRVFDALGKVAAATLSVGGF